MTFKNLESEVLWSSPSREPVMARIAVAGDFLPAGKAAIPEGRKWRDMASSVSDYFDDVATSFVNLECCLDVGALRPRPLPGLGDIVSAPVDSLDYLDAIRCTAPGIANNHIFDFGDAGVKCTRRAISSRSMIPLGAGRALTEPPEVFIWAGSGDIRVGFWAAATATRDPSTPKKAGVEPATLARARQAYGKLRKLGARFCVALLHAGAMRTNRPDSEQVQLMDSLANSGFDIVAASHSHRISGHRRINANIDSPSFCFYGLGTLVSGYANGPLEREGLVVAVGLSRNCKIAAIEVRPVALAPNGFGAIPTRLEGRKILDRFAALSDEISDGSHERLFYRDISKGLLRLYARDAKASFRAGGLRGLARKASRLRTRHIRRLIHRVIG
jgi:hypothetical protein